MNIRLLCAQWLGGVRLYIGLAIGLVTVEAAWWARAVFGSSQLASIRLQEVYAWVGLALLLLALLIGPVTRVFISFPGKQQLREARRLVGVGAAWFALLHVLIAYIGQFKLQNPLYLPTLYQQSLLLGLIGLIILLLLAGSSFNGAMRAWGVWWFRVHRLIYVSLLAVLLHAFMIGAHATSSVTLIGLGAVSAIWIGCNLYLLLQNPNASVWKILALSYGTILLLAILNYGLTQHLGYNLITGTHASAEHSHQ